MRGGPPCFVRVEPAMPLEPEPSTAPPLRRVGKTNASRLASANDGAVADAGSVRIRRAQPVTDQETESTTDSAASQLPPTLVNAARL